MEKVQTFVADIFARESLVQSVLSNARQRGVDEFSKVTIKPLLARGQRQYQFEYHYPQKVTQRNLQPSEASLHTTELLAEKFKQGQFYTQDADFQVLINRRGEVAILRKRPSKQPLPLRHNRVKNYILPEDQPCDFLARLGVMTQAGKVITAKYHKFKQINGFLEMVDDVADHLPDHQPLRVVDFGCGKSYLTFALYHYLHIIKRLNVEIVGLDLRRDVVEDCNRIARDLSYQRLSFTIGDIKSFRGVEAADLVVSLHACDTATDDALARAVKWGAAVILSVPCCQHELFGKISNEMLRPVTKYGLLKERLSAIVTDCLRAQLLEVSGYSVQMLEFIDTEHTRKNILIRALKRPAPGNVEAAQQEYIAFRDALGVQPYIEEALGVQL